MTKAFSLKAVRRFAYATITAFAAAIVVLSVSAMHAHADDGVDSVSQHLASKHLDATVEYRLGAAGESTIFTVTPEKGTGPYLYQFATFYVYDRTSGSYEPINDSSVNNPFQESNQLAFTFSASGDYWLRFYVMDKGASPIFYDSFDLYFSIQDASLPTVADKVRQVVGECEAEGVTDDFGKALWLHDWLIDNCEYDTGLQFMGAESALLRGRGTCEAYHAAYVKLLNYAGIETGRIEGRVNDNHVWTAVKMDGEWYQVDPTWDDTDYQDSGGLTTEMQRHMYFGLDDATMGLVHTDHAQATPGYESVSLKNNYFIRTGLIDQFAEPYVGAVSQELQKGHASFSLDFGNEPWPDNYRNVMGNLVAFALENHRWDFSSFGSKAALRVSYKNGVLSGSVSVSSGGSSTGGDADAGIKPPAIVGWRQIGGKWYYFDPVTGEPVRYSQKINGNWFYFNSQYQMHEGWLTWMADGSKSYFAYGSGRAKLGWQQVGGKWYYFDPSTGKTLRYEQVINGNRFYFNSKSEMHEGWLTWMADGAKSYFAYGSGRAKLGWQGIGGKWYYFDPATSRSVRYSQKINGNWFYFNSQYQMHEGWLTWMADGSKSYFAYGSGRAKLGWQQIGGKWYYFDPATGRSLRYEQKIGGNLFYFNSRSEMVTGWLTWRSDGTRSYFDPKSGRAASGWKAIDGKLYYFNPLTFKTA